MKVEPLSEEEIRNALKNHEPLDPSPDPQCSFCRLILAWIIARASFELSLDDNDDNGLAYHVDQVKRRVGWKDD